MKLILFSILISFSSLNLVEKEFCDDLKFDIEVTHTSNGLNNGVINITIIKSSTKVKAFLYANSKKDNKLNVDSADLINLKSGTYILVLQNKSCSSVKRDIIIK